MKLKEWFKNRRITSSAIVMMRIVIGGYVAYTSVDLFIRRASADIPAWTIPLLVPMILFGAAIAGVSLYDLFTGRYKGGVKDDSEEEE